MSNSEVMQISVGRYTVGIVGLKPLMEELAKDFADKGNDEVRQVMVERLGKTNYIPSAAMDDYGRAFVREFRKFLGQPFEDTAPQFLDIKVLGQGCAQCDSLEQTIMQLLAEINVGANLEHIRDLQQIVKYGIMTVPALLINGKVAAKGTVPSRDRLKQMLLEAASANSQAK